MRKTNKEINIFSMSALDLFASAMGAFILIAVVALPYYLKTDKSVTAELKQVKKELKQCKAINTSLKEENKGLESALKTSQQNEKNCRKKLKETFIAIVAQWGESEIDIDLHVTDPDGNKFNYSTHNRTYSHYPNSRAKLSRDTTKGPGVEVWEIPIAKQGTYKVYYRFYSKGDNGGSVSNVFGNIYTKNGSKAIRKTTLNYSQKKLVATIDINSNGDVVVNIN